MVRPTHHSHGQERPQDQTGGAALAGFDRHSVVGAEKGASDGRSETTDLVMGVAEPVEPVDIAGCYRAERVNLVRLAFLLSGSKEEAEDAVQSVFAVAHGRWGEIGNHGAYLRRAVVNRVRESQRRTFRRRRLMPSDPTIVTGAPSVDETWAVVRSLPRHQREVVVLHFYDDLSLPDIAAALGRNRATVRSDLRRALTRLRRTIHA